MARMATEWVSPSRKFESTPASRLWPPSSSRFVKMVPTCDSAYRSYLARPTNVSADDPNTGSAGSSTLPGSASSAYSTPMLVRPTLPVSLAP